MTSLMILFSTDIIGSLLKYRKWVSVEISHSFIKQFTFYLFFIKKAMLGATKIAANHCWFGWGFKFGSQHLHWVAHNHLEP